MAPETSTTDQSLKDSSSYQSPYPKFRGWALIATPLRPSMTASPVTVNDCVSRHAVQIEPVSSRRLPETGIFQICAGDYRRFLPGTAQIWSLETDRKLPANGGLLRHFW